MKMQKEGINTGKSTNSQNKCVNGENKANINLTRTS